MSSSLSSSEQLKENGLRMFREGDTANALQNFREAVVSFKAENELVGAGEMLNNIGVAEGRLRNWQAAGSAFDEALALFRDLGDVNREGQTLANMGDMYAGMKKRDSATLAYQNAGNLLAESGDKARYSQLLRTLSLHHLRQRNWFQSMTDMEKSLSARPRLGIGGYIFRTMIRFALRFMGTQM